MSPAASRDAGATAARGKTRVQSGTLQPPTIWRWRPWTTFNSASRRPKGLAGRGQQICGPCDIKRSKAEPTDNLRTLRLTRPHSGRLARSNVPCRSMRRFGVPSKESVMITRERQAGWGSACFIGAVALVAVGTIVRPVAAQAVPPEPLTFTKHVAPILQRSCENCHRPGGGAPMSLITYGEVRPWARAIKQRTAAREMPPWFIEKNVGIQRFKDDPSLSDQEIATIAKWVDSGAHQGDPADMPSPRRWGGAADWSIGTPDLVVSSPMMTVKALA